MKTKEDVARATSYWYPASLPLSMRQTHAPKPELVVELDDDADDDVVDAVVQRALFGRLVFLRWLDA